MWTKNAPTKPGIYWVRRFEVPGSLEYGFDEPRIVKLDEFMGRWEVTFCGEESPWRLDNFTAEWCGPIYPPD